MGSEEGLVVLVVEDDPIIGFDLESMLLELGAGSVSLFRDNASALRWLETGRPHYAILDWKLVEGTSVETAFRLKSMSIPIAFVTGYGERLALPEALADCTILDKPVEFNALSQFLDGPSRPSL